MKTKNILLTAGLAGVAYLIYKQSKSMPMQDTQDDTSGGGGGGIGGGFPLSFHPIIPPLVVPRPKPVNLSAHYEQVIETLDPHPKPKHFTPSSTSNTSTTSTNTSSTSTTPPKTDLSSGAGSVAP